MTFAPQVHKRRVTTAIVEVLADAGVRMVFGMPGGYTGGIFSALRDHETIRVVQVREESIGTTAAEAYARTTGSIAVVMGQGEWITGNAGQGLLEALLGCAPVLVLTEMTDGGALSHHAPYQSGTGDYGTWDAARALAGMTKRVMVSRYPVQAVHMTQLAIKHALTGEPGPVAVIFHGDSLRGDIDGATAPPIYPTAGYLLRPAGGVDADVLKDCAHALDRAVRPVIVAGNGVRVGQASTEVLALAYALGSPIVTTASGKGVVPETDPLALGVIGGFGNASALAGLGEADVILAVGTKLSPSDTGDHRPGLIDPSRQVLIQVDTEPLNIGWTFPIDHPVVGDAAIVLRRLADVLTSAPRRGAERVAALLELWDDRDEEAFEADSFPFTPQRVIGALQAAVPASTFICCDAGENRLFMMHWFKAVSAGGYLQPAAGGGMGYAVPAALGAKLARPEVPVIAVCGDGGIAMSLHALLTAVQERIPIGVVVLNNAALGWVLHGMGRRAVAASFDEQDYAAIARSLGCDAMRPDSAGALDEALQRCATPGDRPFVVDIPTSLDLTFKDLDQLTRVDVPWNRRSTT